MAKPPSPKKTPSPAPRKSPKTVIIKRLATAAHPNVQAVLSGLFRFIDKADAIARLESFNEHFIVTTRLPKAADAHTVKLWIHGYALTPKEIEDGFLGNYAAISITEIDGKYSLAAEKQKVALHFHPQKKRPKQTHPDWGHPALRQLKKGITFETLEEAQHILQQLHEEYPSVTIPNPGKLYIMIYSKPVAEKETKKPAAKPAPAASVQKYILEIKATPDDGFKIEYRLNQGRATKAASELTATTTAPKAAGKPKKNTTPKKNATAETQGHFTTMVALRRAAKARRQPPRPMPPKRDSNEA